jgi:hypothetical protein
MRSRSGLTVPGAAPSVTSRSGSRTGQSCGRLEGADGDRVSRAPSTQLPPAPLTRRAERCRGNGTPVPAGFLRPSIATPLARLAGPRYTRTVPTDPATAFDAMAASYGATRSIRFARVRSGLETAASVIKGQSMLRRETKSPPCDAGREPTDGMRPRGRHSRKDQRAETRGGPGEPAGGPHRAARRTPRMARCLEQATSQRSASRRSPSGRRRSHGRPSSANSARSATALPNQLDDKTPAETRRVAGRARHRAATRPSTRRRAGSVPPAAHEAQHEEEEVDEVQVERQSSRDRDRPRLTLRNREGHQA